MTGLTDVRDRTLTMLRAVGVEPDPKQMRTIEKYVRWVDEQIATAHIDGRVMDREVARGHEIVVTHDPISGPAYEVHCLEPADAPCRLICPEPGCGTWELVRGMDGPHHLVGTLDDPIRHDLVESGECNACQWINNDDAWTWELGSATSEFEVGRFLVRFTWTGDGCEWERA